VPYAVPNSGHGESLQVGVPRARCGVHELYYDGSDWMHNDLTAILLLVPGDLLSTQLGHPAGVDAQIKLAWLGASIATLGGALGAAVQSRESVREAAYTYQSDTELTAPDDPPEPGDSQDMAQK